MGILQSQICLREPPVSFPVWKPKKKKLPCPGIMMDMHRNTKDIFPQSFDGFKLILNRCLSSHFQLSHTMIMSSTCPYGYRFCCQYSGSHRNPLCPNENYPLLLGDMDPEGNLNATITHRLTDKIMGRIECQVIGGLYKRNLWQLHYLGDNFTTSILLSKPDIIKGTGVGVVQYFQSVSQRFAVGVELGVNRSQDIKGGQVANVSLGGRYLGNGYVLSGAVDTNSVYLSYFEDASEQLKIGVEYSVDFIRAVAVTRVGYQVNLPSIGVVANGLLDTNLTVGICVEKILEPLPLKLVLSGTVNHRKKLMMTGIGLVIG